MINHKLPIAIIVFLGGVLLVLCSFCSWALITHGSFAGGIAFLKGQRAMATQELIDLGSCKLGDEEEFSLGVVNLTGQQIIITGSHSECDCLFSGTLPVSIVSHGTSYLPVRFEAGLKEGPFERMFIVYIQANGIFPLAYRVKGVIEND